MSPRTVAVVVGSTRKDSYSRKVAEAVAELAPADLRFKFVQIDDLPFYNEDLETASPPAPWIRFRKEIASADAVLFATPEYNRSVPAVLKNAIDVGSRPYGHAAWKGKPAAIVSVTPGALGGFGANHHLRQSLVFLGMPTLQHETYISGAGTLFDDQGRLVNESTRDFLRSFAREFADWVALTAPARTPEPA